MYAKQFRSHTRWKRANSYYEYSSFYKLTTQNIFAFTQSRNALTVIMNIPQWSLFVNIGQPVDGCKKYCGVGW